MVVSDEDRDATGSGPSRSHLMIAALLVGLLALAALALAYTAGWLGTGGDTAAPVLPSVPSVALPDGEMFGYVRGIEGRTVTFDPARMLTGPEAAEAATADGVIGPGEELPGDFYIQDVDPDEVIVGVSDGVAPVVLTFDAGGSIVETETSLEDLAVAFTGAYSGQAIYGLVAGEFPMTIAVEDGFVVGMKQVYLP